MAKTAQALFARRKWPSRLSPLIAMTDPKRTPDPAGLAKSLPEGSCLIYRHFGLPDHEEMAKHLRLVTLQRGQQLLIGNDPELAVQSGADGVHFRRDTAAEQTALWRRRCPDWIISKAGPKPFRKNADGLKPLDGLIVSSVFPSESPSAGTPIGIEEFRNICSALPVPVIALGGVNTRTAPELIGTGAAGLAAIGGLIRT